MRVNIGFARSLNKKKLSEGFQSQLTAMLDAHIARVPMLEAADSAPMAFELCLSPIPASASLLVEV